MNEENKISINAGTVDELKNLKGIGDVKAQAIIDYRKQHGNFKDVNDLKNVKGIGEATFKGIEDRITLLDKKQLLGKKIAAKVAQTKHVIARKTREEIVALKNTIALLPKNVKLAVLTGEVAALKAATNVRDTVVHIINEAVMRNKKIKEKVHSEVGKVATKSKSALDLLKRELSFEKNTLRAKQFMANLQKAGLYVQNAALRGANKVKDGAENLKYKIEDKYLLAKFKIKTAISRKKNIIARKTAMQIALLKDRIKNKFYRLEDKFLLAKFKIKTAISRKKNIIARKTGMEIALLKDSIKKSMDAIKQAMAVDSEKLEQNRERIAALKEERSKLLNNLLSNDEVALAGPVR